MAIGHNANASTSNSVALGANSLTAAPVSTSSATINGVVYGGFAGSTAHGTVSVGSGSVKRTITNVAAGQITADSTDAINGSQLFSFISATQTQFGTVNTQISSLNTLTANHAASLSTLSSTIAAGGGGAGSGASPSSVLALSSSIATLSTSTASSVASLSTGLASAQVSSGSVVNGGVGTVAVVGGATTNALGTTEVITQGDRHGNTTQSTVPVNTIGASATEVDTTALGLKSQSTAVGATTIGAYATGSGANSTVIGYRAVGSAADAVVLGAENTVKGVGSTAIGQTNLVTGNSSTAVGQKNEVSGNNSGAFGDPNRVWGNASYAFGNDNTIGPPLEGVVRDAFTVGNNNTVRGNTNNVVAIGINNSVASSNVFVMGSNVNVGAGNDGAVVLGHNSAAAGPNTVSVGALGNERRIANVADGVNDSDAATVRQVNQTVNNLGAVVNDIQRVAYSGVALSMAMSGTYMPALGAGESALGVGLGSFQGSSAIAVSFKHLHQNGRMTIGGGVSSTGRFHGVNLGIGWKW